LTKEQRAALNLFDGDKAKLGELEKAIKAMPVISCEAKVHTEGEKIITAQDVITFDIQVTYDFLSKDEKPGYVCSKKYPFLKKHSWYVILTDARTKETVIHFEKISVKEDDGNVAKFEMKQRFGQPGQFNFHMILMNDSYIGFDFQKELTFKVELEDKSRVIPEVSKEDLDAVKGPGMVQSMLETKAEDESEGESSEDGEGALVEKLKKAGLGGATEPKNKASKVEPDGNQLIR